MHGAQRLGHGQVAGGEPRPDLVQARVGIELEDAAVVGPHVEAVARRVHGQGPGAGDRKRRDKSPVAQVVGAHLRARRHVQTVARAPIGHAGVVPARLDGGIAHGYAKLTPRGHLVVTEGLDAERHHVLGQVGMGVLVDRVRDPVPPVLQELRPGPGVIDLIEVHLIGLGQAEEAQSESRHDHDDKDPDVETIEPAGRLAIQPARTVRPNRTGEEPPASRGQDAAVLGPTAGAGNP